LSPYPAFKGQVVSSGNLAYILRKIEGKEVIARDLTGISSG